MLGPLMLDINGTSLSQSDISLLESPHVGGLILFTRNYESLSQLEKLVQSIRHHAPDILIAVDQEGGRVQRFRQGFTTLPPMAELGRRYLSAPSEALQLVENCGWLMAAEIGSIGVDFSFAPVLDLDYGISEVIGDRAFSSDPEIVVRLATAFVSA
jgi:beta-N-acetylhexosaminidase